MSKNDGKRMTWLGRWIHLPLSLLSLRSLHPALAALMVITLVSPYAVAQVADVASAASAPAEPVLAPPAAAPIALPLAAPSPPAPATALTPPVWQGLKRAQQLALAPLERDWNSLDDPGRSKWLVVAARFNALPPEDQSRLHERMRAWARLSPAERQQARIGFQVAQEMGADRRQAKWEAYQALPSEKRLELADKAAQKRVVKSQGSSPSVVPGPQVKSNLVPAIPKGVQVKPVALSVLQAKPGATTVLITQVKRLPAHQQAGQTKVFADPDLVDSKTLLPKQKVALVTR